MRTLAILVVMSFNALGPPTAYGDQAWNFSPEDYRRLLSEGRDLSFADHADWLPGVFKEAMHKGIAFVLAEADGIKRTSGVNAHDFYHAHVVCRKDHLNESLAEDGEAFSRAFYDARQRSLGRDEYTVSPTNLNVVSHVIRTYERRLQQLLMTSLTNRHCANFEVLFHTYEDNKPTEMRYGDPRRNIIIGIGDDEAQGYTPPDLDSASSYKRDYLHIEQLPFLIDDSGQIFVTIGVESNLLTILPRR